MLSETDLWVRVEEKREELGQVHRGLAGKGGQREPIGSAQESQEKDPQSQNGVEERT